MKDIKAFSSDLNLLLEPIENSGFNLKFIQQILDNADYLVIVQDERLYESSKKVWNN